MSRTGSLENKDLTIRMAKKKNYKVNILPTENTTLEITKLSALDKTLDTTTYDSMIEDNENQFSTFCSSQFTNRSLETTRQTTDSDSFQKIQISDRNKTDLTIDKIESFFKEKLENQPVSNQTLFEKKKSQFIPLNEITLIRVLKNGARIGFYMNEKVNLKRYENVEEFYQESNRLMRLWDSHIQRIYGYTIDGGVKLAVLEYFEYNLEELAVRKNITKKKAVNWAADLTSAVEICQIQGIIHSRINPKNILVNADGKLALSNFVNCADYKTEPKGINEFQYCSPQQLLGKEIGPETDIWALGAVFYFMLTKKMPFDKIAEGNQHEFIKEIVFLKKLPERIDYECAFAKDILKQTFELRVDKRPSVKELYNLIQDIARTENL